MFKAFTDLLRVVQRVSLAWGNERGGQQGGTVQGKQFLQHPVVGHAQADGLALRVAQRRGTSLVASRMKVNGPGVADLSSRNCRLSTIA
jgi:hypothetical protein